MIINAQKTKHMYITRQTNKPNIPDIKLKLQNHDIELSESERLLGINIDNTLKWKTHIDKTIKKCNTQLFLLMRIKQYLDVPTRKLFFNAYILPHLDYCCSIWGNTDKKIMNEIIKFQKRAARVILDVQDFDTPSDVLFNKLQWMKFDKRVEYKKSILVYKSLNDNQFPTYMQQKFTKLNQVHSCNLRSITNEELYVPSPNFEFSRKSLAYSGPKIWNEIPKAVRKSDTRNKFQNAYIKWQYP